MKLYLHAVFKYAWAVWACLVLATPLVAQGEAHSKKICEIPLHDDGHMVDQVQADFIIRCLDKAKEEGFDEIVLTIDTYGGYVFSAEKIAEKLLSMDIPTTAYVKTKAISAGTFIAYSCDKIVMQERTTMGDAQMVMPKADGSIEVAPEKQVSYYRAEWKKFCEENNRSFDLARGFFEQDLEILQVKTPTGHDFMTRSNYDLKFGELKKEEQPKILDIICRKGELLTLTSKQAGELGVAKVYSSYDDFLKTEFNTDRSHVKQFNMTFNDTALRYLGANEWIFVLLTLAGLSGIYMEFKAPGFGISGFMALVCFTLLFGSRYLIGTGSPFEMAVFVVGVMLCLIEIFVTPGLGLMGMAGMGCMLLSLVFVSLPPFDGVLPSTTIHWDWLKSLLVQVSISFACSLVVFFVFLPQIFKSDRFQKRLGQMEFSAAEGYVVDNTSGKDLLNQSGEAVGDLKPSGKMRLGNGELLDVISDSGFVESGQKIRIVEIDGNVVHVREMKKNV